MGLSQSPKCLMSQFYYLVLSFKETHLGLISSEPSPCPFSARLSAPLLPTNPLTLFSYSNPLAPSLQIPVSTNQPENTTLWSKVTKCPSSCPDQRTFCQWAADEFGTRGLRLRAIAGSTKTMAPIFANVARHASGNSIAFLHKKLCDDQLPN